MRYLDGKMKNNKLDANAKKMVADSFMRRIEALLDSSDGESLSESPIEEMFFRGSVLYLPMLGMFGISFVHRRRLVAGKSVTLSQQVDIGDYRADFVFEAVNGDEKYLLIVECDGHEFHEKNKAQAARDKQRDRFFISEGYTVMRFTGSEVYNDVLGCVGEVISWLVKKLDNNGKGVE